MFFFLGSRTDNNILTFILLYEISLLFLKLNTQTVKTNSADVHK